MMRGLRFSALFSMLVSGVVLGVAKKEYPCPQIDKAKVYQDGIPFCPESVKENAYTVTRCAFAQAKTWHKATDGEKADMSMLVSGLLSMNSKEVLARSDKLKLQVCRSVQDGDSFLLMYTKPNVRDYSGPFLMYREGGQTSGVVIHSPHDGQDGTHRSTKDAFQNSNALALISNGHPRRISGSKSGGGPYPSDWAHTSADLGYQAFTAFKNQVPTSVHLHIHGLAANRVMVTDSVGWKGPKHLLRTAFIDAFKKAIGDREFPVTEWRFNGWITGIAMTQGPNGRGREANERWVGAEVAVRIHQNTKFLTKAVRNLEEDYLKKPRPTKADLEKGFEPDEDDMPAGVEDGTEAVEPVQG